MIRELARRLAGAVTRARVVSVSDAGGRQAVDLDSRAGEGLSDVEHLQPWGLTGVAPAGSEGVVLRIGGAPDHQVAICVGDRVYRPTGLSSGDVTIYDGHGNRIDLRSGAVTVTADSVTINAAHVALGSGVDQCPVMVADPVSGSPVPSGSITAGLL